MADTPGKLTIAEAVKAGWAARPTLYRALKAGRLSAEKSPQGRVLLDVSELVRVYGEPRQKRTKVSGKEKSTVSHLASKVDALKARLDAEQKETGRLKESLSEAQEREKWFRGQLDAQQRLLASYGRPTGFWSRLFRKGGGEKPSGGDK